VRFERRAMPTPASTTTWLIAIDLQHAFVTPGSPWYGPASAAAIALVADLVPLYGRHVIFTHFLPPRDITGSWRAYYENGLSPRAARIASCGT